jgi:hypothetical protein
MNNHSFCEKNRCKNHRFSGKKNYTYSDKRQKRVNAAFWGRFATRNCAKESSHDGAKFLQSDGEDK